MPRLTLDIAAASIAVQATTRMEVCDPTGRVIGYFIPTATREDYANAVPQVSDEELDRREGLGGGRSLKEIIVDLEKRG